MGVLVEAISVIVPVALLNERYPGGVARYEQDAPNGTFCADGSLSRVGFMVPVDVKAFVDLLRRHGFAFHDGHEFVDVAVVDQNSGPTSPCSWLEGGRHPLGFSVAWLKGTSPTPMATPIGWSIDQSAKIRFTPSGQLRDGTLKLVRQGMVDVLLDFATGREIYVSRTTSRPI